jgi:2-hydroxy-6-oxonona-2,4-dienedioate hydrolase
MANRKTGCIELNDGKIHYEIAGEGETVVLAHAAHVDSGMWDAQWDAFTGKYRVLRFDMRGYGQSDVASGPISRREEFRLILDKLDIDKAALIGCSLGGELIIDFALESPERVTALIPVSAVPSGFEMQGEPPRYMMEMFGELQQGNADRASELQTRIWVDGIYRESEQVDASVRQHWAAMNRIAVRNNTFMVADSQPVNPLDPPAVNRLSEIQVPTLAIVGSFDHPELLRAADVMQKQSNRSSPTQRIC